MRTPLPDVTITMVLVSLFGISSDLMAATAVREDTSMFLVYMFLGMCALIVIMQLLPALFLIFGTLKSLFLGEKKEVKANAVVEK